MPCTSAVPSPGLTSMTPVRPETSRPGAWVAARGRKRLVVRLPSRTASPAGIAAYDARSRWTARSCSSQLIPRLMFENLLLVHVPLKVGEVHDDSVAPEVARRAVVPAGQLGPPAQHARRVQPAGPAGDRHRHTHLDRAELQ